MTTYTAHRKAAVHMQDNPPESTPDPAALRVLLIENDEADYQLIKSYLIADRRGHFELDWADSYDAGMNKLLSSVHDVCLLDYKLGGHDGFELLRVARVEKCEVPVILLTGAGSFELDVDAMNEGASDYLSKDELTPALLERSIRYAIRNRRLESQLHAQATTDSLTSLDNARSFRHKIAASLAMAERRSEALALLFIDLDRFKAVNDTYGHQAGDQVIVEVAHRLRSVLRKTDIVGRLGGDEFVIVLQGLSLQKDIERVTRDLLQEIGERSYDAAGHTVSIGLSIGVSLYPEQATDLDRLIALADTAMYHAKSVSRNAVELYDPDMGTRTGRWPNE